MDPNTLLGSIPAHTGERCRPCRVSQRPGVYPRTYGGTVSSTSSASVTRGLSPHIRGNARLSVNASNALGSIPAHTGERRPGPIRNMDPWVYPRTYGGTRPPPGLSTPATGLSPHIRGNGDLTELRLNVAGSIPAHTGERPDAEPTCAMTGVYPRTYGGTQAKAIVILRIRGLSPHIRGNVKGRSFFLTLQGSIPAHTGERPGVLQAGPITGVYPRTYGGTSGPGRNPRMVPGLSPHIRGNDRDKS